MSGRGTNDATPARNHRLQTQNVCARAVEDGENFDSVTEVFCHHNSEMLGVLVFSVGNLVSAVDDG